MIDVSLLPTVNATLNATAAVLLSVGYGAIRMKRVNVHKVCMGSAFGVSIAFLVLYVTYHVIKHQTTGQAHTSFVSTGPIRAVYLIVLTSHVILAVAIVPMVAITLYRALRGRFAQHARIARWTLPIWLYVSVTGVIVYGMLYHLDSIP